MKSDKKSSAWEIDFIPLTDLVSNAVGIVIFTLIIAVLSSRQMKYSWFTPAKETLSQSEVPYNPVSVSTTKSMLIFVCQGGKLYSPDIIKLQERLLYGLSMTSRSEMGNFVNALSERKIIEGSFKAETATYWDNQMGFSKIYMLVDISDKGGAEHKDQLERETSEFGRVIRNHSAENTWINFAVDPESIDVFKVARKILIKKGYQVGWIPLTSSWPLVITIHSREKYSGVDPKPQGRAVDSR